MYTHMTHTQPKDEKHIGSRHISFKDIKVKMAFPEIQHSDFHLNPNDLL